MNGKVILRIDCHGTSSSNGVAILIPPGFDYVLKNTYKDDEGRILIIQIALQDVEYTIVTCVCSHKGK